VLASYRFDEFRSHPGPGAIGQLFVVAGTATDGLEALTEGAARGVRAAQAAAAARDLINTPPSDLPPRRFAERVVELFGATGGVRVSVWDEGRIAEERLGGLLGVSRGSAEPPRLVRADYTPADPVSIDGRTPHVVLVGKGITFDSGGLSLKTADGMTTMKTDMSGAAIVLMALAACADLGVRVRVSAIAPLTENMPGSRAIKPGDVLTIRNGSTIEVLNTDAEGRLVLADGLTYARQLGATHLIDAATLTGACVVALGMVNAGAFANDDAIWAKFDAALATSGEKFWRLPLGEEYAEQIKSEIGDIKNTGGRWGGAITAAEFLRVFVEETPWIHLDIAGLAWVEDAKPYIAKGPSGVAVRSILEWVRSYAE
jgi:leucyl aminopeptidase